MVLLRAAYTKIFPQLDKILSIDVDTIVNQNISQLWDLDLTNYYIAAAQEQELTKQQGSYINMGVAMMNLKKIRQDKKDDQLIASLNTYWYRYKEQDCFNEIFRGNIYILPSDYNVCIQSQKPYREKITHFAGIYELEKFPHFNYYKNLPIQNIKRNQKDNITLDIIIPTYKNKNQLRRTLKSITFNKKINVIVIDDCSELDYSDILEEYPQIHFYYLQKNVGPGMARQYGIQQSQGTYITFLDSGDYFYKQGLETILNEIQKNTYIKMYSFSYVYDNKNILQDSSGDKTIGNVYKRSFIQMYNINFSVEGSYANQDYGFSRACRIIINYLEQQWHFHIMRKHIYTPVFYEHIDNKSLTKSQNNDFSYTKMPNGIIINGIHAYNIAKLANVRINDLIQQLCHIMAMEYFIFIKVISERPEYTFEVWDTIRDFYLKYYRTYSKFAISFLNTQFKIATLPAIKQNVKNPKIGINYNIKQFIKELETNENCPIRYLT